MFFKHFSRRKRKQQERQQLISSQGSLNHFRHRAHIERRTVHRCTHQMVIHSHRSPVRSARSPRANTKSDDLLVHIKGDRGVCFVASQNKVLTERVCIIDT